MPEDDAAVGEETELFISFATSDRGWAEWIGWHLLKAGYRVRLYLWDIAAGNDFVTYMHEASERSRQTITLLSQAYLSSAMANAEWHAAFADDADGRQRRIIPLRIEPVEPPGLLKGRVYADLFEVAPEVARERLLAAVSGPTGPPQQEPPFPGQRLQQNAPRFPSVPQVFNFPARNPHFTGRAVDLEDLRIGLAREPDILSVLHTEAIHGLGGVGKSQLAIEYGHRYASEYEVAWWVPADLPHSATVALAELARRLEIPDEDDPERQIELLFEHLRTHSRWLLVFDNAESPDDLKALMPRGGLGHVLVTSRWSTWRTLGESVHLGVLPRAESVELLRSRSGVQQAEDTVLREIAAELGDLPLALEEAAAYLEETRIDASAYLELLRERSAELLLTPAEETTATGDQKRVATVWTVSLDRLRDQAPMAETLLDLCAFLAPDAIPRTLFTENAERLGPLKELAADPLAFNDALRMIGRFSMGQVTDGALSLHRLVQAVIVARLSQGEQRNIVALLAMLLFDVTRLTEDQVKAMRALVPHCLKVIEHARRLDVPFALTAPLLSNVGHVQQLTGQVQRGMTTTREAVDLLDDGASASTRRYVLSAHARALAEAGDFDAAVVIQQALVDEAIEEAGEDAPLTLTAKGELAYTYWANGRPQDAVALEREVLDARVRLHGPTDPASIHAKANLASSLHDLGQHEEAVVLHEQVLEVRLATLGENSQATVSTMNNLAAALFSVGDLERAQALQERALDGIADVWDGTDPNALVTLSNRGTALHEAHRFDEAEAILEHVALSYEDIYGRRHPKTIEVTAELAILRAERDDDSPLDEAEAILQVLLEVNGALHPISRNFMANLSLMYQQREQFERGIEIAEMAVEACENALDADNAETLSARASLTDVRLRAGHDEERTMLTAVVADHRRVFGPNHPSTLSCMASLAAGVGYRSVEEAVDLLTETLEHALAAEPPVPADLRRSVGLSLVQHLARLDETHEAGATIEDVQRQLAEAEPDAVEAAVVMATVAFSVGRKNAALATGAWNRGVAFARGVDGLDPKQMIQILAGAGNAHWRIEDFAAARALEEEAFERASTAWGVTHPHSVSVLASLCVTYADAGELEAALSYCRKAYAQALDQEGPHDHGTARIAELTGGALIQLKRPIEAIELLTHTLAAVDPSATKAEDLRVGIRLLLAAAHLSADDRPTAASMLPGEGEIAAAKVITTTKLVFTMTLAAAADGGTREPALLPFAAVLQQLASRR